MDECATLLRDDGYAALRTVGGTGDKLARRESFALIGQKGLVQGTAMFERIGGKSNWYTYTVMQRAFV